MKKRYPILILILSIFLFMPIQVNAEIKTNIVPIYTADDLQKALDSTEYDGYTFKIINDISGNFTHDVNTSFTLDLNDHFITGIRDGSNHAVITLKQGTMTLIDSSTYQVKHYYRLIPDTGCAEVVYDIIDEDHSFEGGYITGGYSELDSSGGGIAISKTATLIMNGGTIIGNYTNGSGGGIYAYGKGKIVINGGNIIGNSFFGIRGNDITINGNSKIIDNYTAGIAGDSIININGGQICRSKKLGISASNNSYLTINKGVISDNGSSGVTFGGIKLIMNGGTIKNNGCDGISIGKGLVEINGGKIEYNKEDGIMNMNTSGSVSIIGGEITNNDVSGVHIAGKTLISGSPNIYNNHRTINGKTRNCNVLINNNCFITINGNLNEDAIIGISLYSPVKGSITPFTIGLPDKSRIHCFKSDLPECEIVEKGTQLALRIPSTLSTDDAYASPTTQSQPSVPKLTTAKNNKKKTITLKWLKVDNIDGYQIQYALNKKFTKSVKMNIPVRRSRHSGKLETANPE